MQDTTNQNSRDPNATEQFIIERYLKNMRVLYIELFIFFGVCDIILWCFTFLFFSESFIVGLLCLVVAILLGLLCFSIWSTIKETNAKNFNIISDQGLWSISAEGSGKTLHYLSKVNGLAIASIIPEMVKIPKLGETKHIEYEYVTLFDSPLYGHDHIFISINNKKFSKEHMTYMEQVKPFSILSFICSIAFISILIFCFCIEFENTFLSYVCLVLSFIFIRTIIRWRRNYKLQKKMKIKMH